MSSFLPFLRSAAKLSAFKNAAVEIYRSKPRVANACIGFLTFSSGDLIAQRLERESSSHPNEATIDVLRSAQIGLLGLAMNGVCLHYWYALLDKVLGGSMKSKSTVILKMIVDQIVYAPFAITSFFSFATARNATSYADFIEKMRFRLESSFLTTYIADCNVWPLANFVNFRYVSLPFRPTFTAVTQLLWQTYMSVIVSRTGQQNTGDSNYGNAVEVPQSVISVTHCDTVERSGSNNGDINNNSSNNNNNNHGAPIVVDASR